MGGMGPEVFHFPRGLWHGANQEKKTKETMGTCFKNFKLTLYQKFILEDKEPNWDGDEYASQKNF
jgi:hypothetical protein